MKCIDDSLLLLLLLCCVVGSGEQFVGSRLGRSGGECSQHVAYRGAGWRTNHIGTVWQKVREGLGSWGAELGFRIMGGRARV